MSSRKLRFSCGSRSRTPAVALRKAGGSAPSLRSLLALGGCLLASGCGLPQLQDIRQEYAKNVSALGGLTPVYPPREMMRIGQLWIGDASTAAPNSGLKPRDLTSMVLSDALVAPMETERKARMNEAARQSKSVASLSTDVLGTGAAPAYYKQGADNTLEISALPKYTLASVDQAALSGAVPTAAASFFASLGFTQSKYLTLEAIGVEIAELPADTFAHVVRTACTAGTGTFGDAAERDVVQGVGYNSMRAWWQQRQSDAGSKPIAPFAAQLYLLHKVFYMRGIRYIFNDEKAASAVLGASLANQFPTGVTPPPAPTPAAPAPTPAGTGAGATELQAQMTALAQQINGLKNALPANTNTNIAGSYARATAQGVEMVDLFERPVAFGYVAFAENLSPAANGQWQGGIGEFCKDFGAP